ncbi:50S ribosomal protein L19e [Methanococcus maripaludis]|jgi:large subunit ribosomal protein L19e|uniref:Large ribosomal subunit protein eL19 n=5 Tax=Methanococcus maripaludis TaxID=39152 RepID=Q6LXD5_METMP|nr:50S ribosomal protein L19e [Methanococcus maripaludis]MDK2929213.1 large subunit ribosomal protein L19e [Methanococcus sp.]AEK20437.1 50S ribosomal protein L19e [Methanococcus maripaludis X1]AVB76800.1 50S ribosomal protein L19e [Methanococcus maripaludis]MBA2847316.1 large subunit ribosomal protein L19e [Methanococcus maripaludis]MBA2850179.1 large subunit ribosomal protein L19e [Methanococcus maripaludis]
MDVSTQRRIAAAVLDCGIDRVWIDPENLEKVKMAITKDDIRLLINDGIIVKKQEKGISSARKKEVQEQKRKGKRKGPGSRKGAKGARTPKKEKWMNTIRPLRKMLKELRENEKIERSAYRKLYRMAKGGAFRSRNHMKLYMKEHGILAE